jgi:ankyrin repeat protein
MKKQIVCLVAFLIVLTVAVSAQTSSANQRLWDAAQRGNLSDVRAALSAGADINYKPGTGATPLIWASYFGHLEVVKYLVESGANLNLISEGKTALDFARSNNKPAVVEYLTNASRDHNKDLFTAAQAGSLSGVKSALDNGANINYKLNGEPDNTSLIEASARGHLEVVKYLLEKGADLNLATSTGNTALMLASSFGHLEVVKYLVDKGAVITRTNNVGRTALYYARNNNAVVEYLSTTILLTAVKNGDLNGVKVAVENKANINYRDDNDNTPLVIATQAGHYAVTRYLVENGANVNARNNEGRSALNYVYDRGDMDIYDFLVAHDARTFTPNPTPAPAPVIVVQAPAPAQTPAPQASSSQSSSSGTVAGGGSAAATGSSSGGYTPSAPAQTGGSSSSQSNTPSLAQVASDALRQFNEAIRGSLDTGRYRMSGRREEIYKTGMGNFGNITYTDASGTRTSGTWTISGDRFTINLQGTSLYYTITSQTTFSGHGEDWVHAGL